MKKLMSIILCVVMVLSLIPGAVAAEDGELANVVKLAKSRLSIPASFTEFESSKYTAGGQNVYSLTWRTGDDDYSEINASVLPSGEITSYNYYDADRDYNKTGVAAFEKEEYRKLAKEWISRVNPSYAPELDTDAEVWIDGVHSYNARVNFGRKINGIPVDGDSVYISLDKYNGKVTSMHSQWVNPEKTADAENIISAEEAGKILGEKAGLRLRYEKLRDEAYAVLMYSPASYGMMINAETGEDFTVEYIESEDGGSGGGGASGVTNDSAAAESSKEYLTLEELENIEEVESLLSKEELSGLIKKMANTAVSSFAVKSVTYRNTARLEEEKVYEARVYLTNADGESANVTFDAKTGELKSLYTYLAYNPNKKQTKKREDMKQTAKRFVDTWASDVADAARVFEYGDDTVDMGGYFVFTHDVDGIEYAGNAIRIRVDESTGKILSFSKSWDKEISFETAENVISLEEATEKYVDAATATLYYIGNKRELYASDNAEELALIYRFSDNAPSYVNAKTGECYDWSMGQEQREPEEYTLQADLRGHWAENAVKVLADNGIVLSYEEQFRPGEAITQKEIALLVESFDSGYRPYEVSEGDYKSYIERLVRRNVIKTSEKNPDKKVTREECAAYLVRLFDYGNASEITGIYKTGFSDEAHISSDKVGAVAIAKGLGLVSGNGGKFNPKSNVTRAELAMMLYNALEK